MKKIISSILIFIFTFMLVGCGGKKEETKQTSKEQPKQEQKQEVKEEKKEEEVKQETKKDLKQLFKLSDIKNKSQDEVNSILDSPKANRKEKWHYHDTKEEAPNCFVNTYEKNNMEIEVFFIDGKAATITVTPKETVASSDINNILKMFYLSFSDAEFANKLGMRWKNQFGVYEFAINFEGEKVSFIYIILDEKYR